MRKKNNIKTKQVKLMVNGIPGRMASTIAKMAIEDERLEVLPVSFTSVETKISEISIGGLLIKLIRPSEREKVIERMNCSFISVDYTIPSVVNQNVRFYCKHSLPFVMGTTGGDRDIIRKSVVNSTISAVVAPNMAKQVVAFNAMLEYCANKFPDIFRDYFLVATESHQKGKVDTSATAKETISNLKDMGMKCSIRDILKVRDPSFQINNLKIPEKYINGHSWHNYSIFSKDKTVMFRFQHHINGRSIYGEGTIDAVCFLDEKIKFGYIGKIFSMIDVLKN